MVEKPELSYHRWPQIIKNHNKRAEKEEKFKLATMMRTILQRCATRQHTQLRFMSKEIKFGVEGRAAMLNGVDLLADAVQVSFRTVIEKIPIFRDSFLEFRFALKNMYRYGIRGIFPTYKNGFSFFEDLRYPYPMSHFEHRSDLFILPSLPKMLHRSHLGPKVEMQSLRNHMELQRLQKMV